MFLPKIDNFDYGNFIDNNNNTLSSLQKAPWTIELSDDGNFERFFKRLDDVDQAIVRAAMENVLRPLSNKICTTEWGKHLGQGLYEFRIRRDLATILREYGPEGSTETVSPRSLKRRPLIRVFCTFHGNKVVLPLGGYNKSKDTSKHRQNREIQKARKTLTRWRKNSS